ncbi:MAG: HAD family phosphatase [Muribaculaceae bacterium]|nr:HAD family phosphatase [Muribaculaceae bacterium]
MDRIEGIRNVVFDLGGVIIDLRRENAVEELERLGIADAGELLGLYRQEGPFLELEVGRISPAEFFDSLRSRCRPGVADTDIERAFNAFLIGLPVERLAMLRRLRARGKRVYALSNTNAVMFNSWIKEAFKAEGMKVDDYFDGIIASFREGVCKPDEEIFRIALSRYGLKGDETLMLDDSAANCEAARRAGMRALEVGLPGSGRDALAIEKLID